MKIEALTHLIMQHGADLTVVTVIKSLYVWGWVEEGGSLKWWKLKKLKSIKSFSNLRMIFVLKYSQREIIYTIFHKDQFHLGYCFIKMVFLIIYYRGFMI